MEVIKNTSHMGILIIKEIDRKLAKEIIINNHYSHKWNTSFGKINIGIFQKDNPMCLGVASFGNLMNPNSYKSISDDFNKDSVVELNRLWIDDLLGRNAETILIGASWKIIRDGYPNIKAVQSFADGRLGCGTIYKASNFNYYGFTESLFYEDVETGITYHKVPMENTLRPTGMTKLNELWCLNRLKPFKVKTYRYIYPLYKNIKIKLKQINYPTYDKGITYLDDYIHNPNLIFRSFILCDIYELYQQKYNIKKYILSHYSKQQINEFYAYSIKNESILQLAKKNNKHIENYFLIN